MYIFLVTEFFEGLHKTKSLERLPLVPALWLLRLSTAASTADSSSTTTTTTTTAGAGAASRFDWRSTFDDAGTLANPRARECQR